MIFQIGLAGQIVEIRSLYKEVQIMCRKYLVEDRKPSLSIEVKKEDIERENKESERVQRVELRLQDRLPGAESDKDRSREIVEFSPEYLETVAVYRKIASEMPAFDTFVMHGSVIATQGQGYMITAPSGVGKTTRTKLWLEHIPGSFVVNGDKPLLKITENAVYAYGTPWCGKESWNTNTSVPLRAIFFLERLRDGESDSVTELRFSEAFPALYSQTFRPDQPEARRKTLHLLQAMSERVKLYRLRSDRTAEAVLLAWEVARP